MSDQRFGSTVRAIRQRRGWRQSDLAARARVSPSTISRVERGHFGTVSVDTIRAVAAALDIRVDVVARWRGGDLDRLLNARHSALHESVGRLFRVELPAWVLAPEVSFSIFGERGVIDIVAWHPGRRALLVIELKTDIADVNELVGGVDRKRRLAAEIVRERGWRPKTISTWVIVASGRTNRRRIDAHRTMLRAAFPMTGRQIRRWLKDPAGEVDALSLWPATHGPALHPTRRVRVAAGRDRAAGGRDRASLGSHARPRDLATISPGGPQGRTRGRFRAGWRWGTDRCERGGAGSGGGSGRTSGLTVPG